MSFGRWVAILGVLIILSSLFRSFGIRLGLYGEAMLFAIVCALFKLGTGKDKEREDTISTRSEEVVSLEEEIKDIDKSIQGSSENEQIRPLINSLGEFTHSLSLFKNGKWEKGETTLAEIKESTEKAFHDFLQKDKKFAPDWDLASFEKAKRIAQKTLVLLESFDFNWWEKDKHDLMIEITEKTRQALINVGNGFFVETQENLGSNLEVSEITNRGKESISEENKVLNEAEKEIALENLKEGDIPSFEDGLKRIDQCYGLFEKGILSKDEFERIKQKIMKDIKAFE
jgi:hypothetical protein